MSTPTIHWGARTDPQAIECAADRLEHAMSSRRPCLPIRDLISPKDVASAYAVQELISRRAVEAGRRIVGRKIGLTSLAVQRQVGVDRPDFGVLFADMEIPLGAPVPSDRLLQPKAEVEIAFVLGSSLDGDRLDIKQVRNAVAYATVAIEIVDSRIGNWDISVADTIADNASSGLYVLGSRQVQLSDFEPALVTMQMHKGGVLVSSGMGRECLGDPLAALAWLATTCRDLGVPLESGEVVLSGALGPMVNVEPGCTIDAQISSLGTVTASFTGPLDAASGDFAGKHNRVLTPRRGVH